MSATPPKPADQPSRTEKVAWGLLVMSVGVIVLLRRAGMTDFLISYHMWPIVPIVMSLARIASPGHDGYGNPRGRAAGGWLLCVGVWGLINEYRVFGLYYHSSWPLLLIGGGLTMVWGALEKGMGSGCGRVTHGGPRS